MAIHKPRIVILGAGPAGLGAAFKLTQAHKADVTVVERQATVGGNAGSFELAGHRVDFGSHRLHPSCHPDILQDIKGFLGDKLLRRPRHGRIRLRGRWIHFPLQPIDLVLRLDRRFAVGALRDMLLGGRNRRRAERETFASVLQAQLGRTICEQFYLPYAAKIWGRDPDRLSAVQAKRRVAAGTFSKLLRKVFGALPGVKPVGFDYFYYPLEGFGSICEAYADAAQAAGAEILLAEPAVRLEAPQESGGVWQVVTEKDQVRRSIEADQIWSTIPVSLLARLVEPKPPAEVVTAARSIHYRAMALAYLHLPVTRFTAFDAHYFPDPDLRISRLSEPKNYSGTTEPRGSTVLCAEIPCSRDDDAWKMTSDDVGELVIDNLARAGLPLAEKPLAVEVRRLAQAYPIYDLGFEEHLGRLDRWVEGLESFLTFGRQGLFVHDNTHHALYMAYSAVDCLVEGGLDRERWQQYRTTFETHVVED